MRALVALLALVPLLASGCLNGDAPVDDAPDDLPEYDSAYDVVATNGGLAVPRTLRFVVEEDGRVVHDETRTFRPGDGPWIIARRDTGCPPEDANPAVRAMMGCHSVEVTLYGEDGEAIVSTWGGAEDCHGDEALFRFKLLATGASTETGCSTY